MGRTRNDGKGRLGGRAKGTPNKTTSDLREWINDLINANRERIEADITSLAPLDRLRVLEKFVGYVLPKPTVPAENPLQSLGLKIDGVNFDLPPCDDEEEEEEEMTDED